MKKRLINKAHELLDLYYQLSDELFPIDMKILASLAGIKAKEKYMIDDDCSGQLVIKNGEVFAFVNIFDNKQRQNFTIAHEIAHTFFDNFKEVKYRTIQVENDEEETLCDEVASELLIPTHEFTKKLAEFGESISSLTPLSKYFNASLEAIAVKFTQHIHHQDGAVLFVSDYHSKFRGLRVTNIIPLKDWDVFIPTGAPLINNPRIADSFYKNQPINEFIEIEIGPLKGNYHIETLPTKFQLNKKLYNKGYIYLKREKDHSES